MSNRRIPINIWDDYSEDETGKLQETYAYIESSEYPEVQQEAIMEHVFNYLQTLEFPGVQIDLEGVHIEFTHLTHVRREELVEQFEKAKLSFEGIPIEVYSES